MNLRAVNDVASPVVSLDCRAFARRSTERQTWGVPLIAVMSRLW